MLLLQACSSPAEPPTSQEASGGAEALASPGSGRSGSSTSSTAAGGSVTRVEPTGKAGTDKDIKSSGGASTVGGSSSGGGTTESEPGTVGGSKTFAPASSSTVPATFGGTNGITGGRGGTNSASSAGGSSVRGGNTSQGGTANNGGTRTSTVAGVGGRSTGGSTTAATGTSADNAIPMIIPTPSNGQGEIRNGTTVLKNATNGGKDVWDFENQRIGVNNTADCEDGEGQVTVFELEDGVTVRNLIIAGGIAGGNGIVCKGNCTLEYVYWEDICEDAATNSKDGATMTLDHVIALHATDKVFQHNAKAGSKTIVKNSYVADFGKLWRSCGDCTANGGPRNLVIDNVRVESVKTAIAGANQNYGDTVTIKDLYVKGGYSAANDKPKICTEYLGVTDHNGESTKVDDGNSQWNTATCKVSQSDVKSY